MHLVKVETFSVLIDNLILRGGPTSMICKVTNNLDANVAQFDVDVET